MEKRYLMKKNYIFKKSFDEIFTPERIEFEIKKQDATINGDIFDFAPHKKFFLPKDNNELREINIPDNKARIIQKILVEEFSYFFKFSDRSYA